MMGTGVSKEPFVTTRWTLVLRSQGGSEVARAALGELCEAYWGPVHGFMRRWCGDADRARDLTQEFFGRLLAARGVDGAEPGRGRFRSFLLGAVRHFLADQHDRETAAKRGGGRESVPLEEVEAEANAVESREGPGAALLFDQAWAVSLVNRALARLESEYGREERAGMYRELKAWLPGEITEVSQATAAERLGWTENAVRVAVHRLRRRFRALVRDEIAQTVVGEAEVQEEWRHLLDVLVAAG